MADTQARIVGPVAMGTSTTLLYTAPALTSATVRELRVVNTTGSAITFKLSVGADAAGTRLLSDFSVPANGLYKESGWVTQLAAADTIYGHAASSGLTIQICAVEST